MKEILITMDDETFLELKQEGNMKTMFDQLNQDVSLFDKLGLFTILCIDRNRNDFHLEPLKKN